MKEVRLRSDTECRFYLIPEILVEVFDREDEFLTGIEYEDDPQAFEEFDAKWGRFRKEGDIYDTELFIKDKENF